MCFFGSYTHGTNPGETLRRPCDRLYTALVFQRPAAFENSRLEELRGAQEEPWRHPPMTSTFFFEISTNYFGRIACFFFPRVFFSKLKLQLEIGKCDVSNLSFSAKYFCFTPLFRGPTFFGGTPKAFRGETAGLLPGHHSSTPRALA